MRPVEDKSCYSLGPANEISSSNGGAGAISFEFHRAALGKPVMAPSKWDDAQKWLVGLSRSRDKKAESKAKPRDSNADDTRLIAPCPNKEHDCPSGEDDLGLAIWNSVSGVRSICVRDMGTEMTPIASQEPSRTTTPLRATTPAARSPISSGSSTPVRCQQGGPCADGYRVCSGPTPVDGRAGTDVAVKGNGSNRLEFNGQESGRASKQSSLESRAIAWDEAEHAKYMARYKREEVKIHAWENHETRKAELEMKKMEVKAERLKARAKERCVNKLAATRRIAEEKRANAESKLNEKAIKTSQRADYIKRTGNFPSSFSKLPSLCW
ncbi:hypothetical protein V6N13_115529 [Hibiscus sabdariffa]|uniref:Uncharacterized protein n=2 Tax=Hibiscus sabdariffa TaxID=183260 RepID=A0ABR2CS13_9ROSI